MPTSWVPAKIISVFIAKAPTVPSWDASCSRSNRLSQLQSPVHPALSSTPNLLQQNKLIWRCIAEQLSISPARRNQSAAEQCAVRIQAIRMPNRKAIVLRLMHSAIVEVPSGCTPSPLPHPINAECNDLHRQANPFHLDFNGGSESQRAAGAHSNVIVLPTGPAKVSRRIRN
jgi:hypothetical protein